MLEAFAARITLLLLLRTLSLAVAAALFVLAGGCALPGGVGQTTPNPASPAGQQAATAALFGYLFDHGRSISMRDASTFCIGIGGASALSDPAPALLSDLAQRTERPVVAASQCRTGPMATDAAGDPALIFSAELVTRPEPGVYLFQAGQGAGRAPRGLYRVARADDGWQVEPVSLQMLSRAR